MTTFARDPSCDACRRITSGDCGRHGPLTVAAHPESRPDPGEGLTATVRLSGESPCYFVHGWDGWANCTVHGWTGPKEQRSRVIVCPNVNDRLASPVPTDRPEHFRVTGRPHNEQPVCNCGEDWPCPDRPEPIDEEEHE